jgi:hypothetical protein
MAVLDELRQGRAGEVAVFVVDRLDPGAIHREQFAAKQVHLPAEQHELAEHRAEGVAVVAAETAMVLKSGLRCRCSQITSMLRWVSASSRRLDRTRLR